VRALTEKFYGRVARLFVMKGDESMPKELRGGGLAAMMLRQAADELIASGGEELGTSAFIHVRLTDANRRRFERRLNRLVADVQQADDSDGTSHALAYALFRAPTPLPPRGDDA
jgi:hypothetical protein